MNKKALLPKATLRWIHAEVPHSSLLRRRHSTCPLESLEDDAHEPRQSGNRH